MQSKYNPKEFEERIYKTWLDNKSFSASVNKDKEPFTIVLPPPNITGILHVGHALNHTYQDIIIRHKRLKGFETLYLPGTDHASIATEVLILRKLEQEGIKKTDLTREEFLKKAWEWREQYGRNIVKQMQMLGDSCDWDRERFTMDEGCSDAVIEIFVKLYEKGLIYKGNRMVNWCVHDKTTISDAEVEHEERDDYLYYVKYPLVGEEGHILVATSRPETIFGDVAIAVNPKDDAMNHLIGKKVTVPLHDRVIEVIGDEAIEIGFGTGALKVTPSHDIVDYEIGKRHGLEEICVIGLDGRINAHGRQYEGLTREEAREKMAQDLEAAGLLEKKEKYTHNVGCCYRCHNVIEPVVSDQWFVSMEELAKPAIKALREKEFEFYPENFEKIYYHWLENIKDWNISRQLWWGHRIPAYYCKSCKKMIVAKEKPDICPDCKCEDFEQDPDVLDTWFSSALWPFSTLGWPKDTEELKYFFPTSVLVTGYDIIFFWVVRMVFSSLEIMGDVPFKKVLINGLVRDKDGKKMSKSSANGIDPIDVIETFGADALRFSLVHGNSTGQDLRLYNEKIESARNFANKLWNASRFVITGIENSPTEDEDYFISKLDLSDKWILTKLNQTIKEVDAALDRYDFAIATTKLYDFIWSDYCDWYIELAKKRFYAGDETVRFVLLKVLRDVLTLMHPIMPFITEEIYSYLPDNFKEDSLLITGTYPKYDEKYNFSDEVVQDMENIMNAIRSIRNIRSEMDIPNSRKAKCMVEGEKAPLYVENNVYFETLAGISSVEEHSGKNTDKVVSLVVSGATIHLPLADLIDFEKEIARLEKEVDKLNNEIEMIDKKLSNESFMAKAPEKVVEEKRSKRENYKNMLSNVMQRLSELKN